MDIVRNGTEMDGKDRLQQDGGPSPAHKISLGAGKAAWFLAAYPPRFVLQYYGTLPSDVFSHLQVGAVLAC